MRRLNKKGLVMSTPIKFILYGVALIVLTIMFTNTVKSNQKITSCISTGGTCVRGTCNFPEEFPYLADKAVGCKADYVCCVPITNKIPEDEKCKGKHEGDVCELGTGDNKGYVKVCNQARLCVTLCEYCSKATTDPICTVKNGTSFNSEFKCGPRNTDSTKCVYMKDNANYGKTTFEHSDPTWTTSKLWANMQGYCNSKDFCCTG